MADLRWLVGLLGKPLDRELAVTCDALKPPSFARVPIDGWIN